MAAAKPPAPGGKLDRPIVRLPLLKEVPPDARFLRKPSVVHVPSNTNYYVCGHCSTLLIIAEESHRLSLVIECRDCGALNDARLP